MSDPEVPPKKRKELENGDDENSKKSKIECSDVAQFDSPGQDDTEKNHFTDETLADIKSEEAKEVDKVQVEWICKDKFSEVTLFRLFA